MITATWKSGNGFVEHYDWKEKAEKQGKPIRWFGKKGKWRNDNSNMEQSRTITVQS